MVLYDVGAEAEKNDLGFSTKCKNTRKNALR
jgi:hypothetical protein